MLYYPHITMEKALKILLRLPWNEEMIIRKAYQVHHKTGALKFLLRLRWNKEMIIRTAYQIHHKTGA